MTQPTAPAANCLPLTREAPSRLVNFGNAVVKAAAAAIIGADPQRRSLLIVNTDAALSVYLLTTLHNKITDGFELAAGAGITLATAAPVYAATAGGNVTVKYVSESGAV